MLRIRSNTALVALSALFMAACGGESAPVSSTVAELEQSVDAADEDAMTLEATADECFAAFRMCLDGGAGRDECIAALRECLLDRDQTGEDHRGARGRRHRGLGRFIDKEAMAMCREQVRSCVEAGQSRQECREAARPCVREVLAQAFASLCAAADERCASVEPESRDAERCERIAERCAAGPPSGEGPAGG